VILAAAGYLFHRCLAVPPSFDEAVYLAQTDAVVHGQRLGAQVFAAQPPGWYWLLAAVQKVGGLAVDQMRLAVMAIALVGLLAVYAIGRQVAGAAAGVASAAVLAVSPPYPTFSAQVSADLPGVVLALLSLACMLAARETRRWPYAIAGGVLFACSELVKLDAFIVLLPVLAYLALRELRPRVFGIAVASAAATFGIAAVVLGSAFHAVWRGAVSYHVAARHAAGPYENVHDLRAFFDLRQPLTWMTIVALLLTVLVRPRRRFWPYWATAVVGAGFILWQRPLHDNHMVILAMLLAVPIGCTFVAVAARWPLPVVAMLGLALAAGYVQETRRLDRNAAPLPAGLQWAVTRLDAASGPSQLVVSDEPLVPFLAHRRMPGSVIDTAVLRFDAGYLSNAEVLAAIDEHHVPVVVAGRSFLLRPRLLRAIASRFPPPETRDGVRVYARVG
jgi:4-amino-4-deoxy-L-arabinose transferase-like glycosyltransferase